MTDKPWIAPELTSANRLPMHSVPHLDRIPMDGRWRFQLLHSPEEEPTATWSETDVPGCWTMSDSRDSLGGSVDPRQGFFDLPHYTNVQMPFAGEPLECPRSIPQASTSRQFDLPAAWLAGRRVVLHVGAAESVLIVRVNGHEVGISKDSRQTSGPAELDVSHGKRVRCRGRLQNAESFAWPGAPSVF